MYIPSPEMLKEERCHPLSAVHCLQRLLHDDGAVVQCDEGQVNDTLQEREEGHHVFSDTQEERLLLQAGRNRCHYCCSSSSSDDEGLQLHSSAQSLSSSSGADTRQQQDRITLTTNYLREHWMRRCVAFLDAVAVHTPSHRDSMGKHCVFDASLNPSECALSVSRCISSIHHIFDLMPRSTQHISKIASLLRILSDAIETLIRSSALCGWRRDGAGARSPLEGKVAFIRREASRLWNTTFHAQSVLAHIQEQMDVEIHSRSSLTPPPSNPTTTRLPLRDGDITQMVDRSSSTSSSCAFRDDLLLHHAAMLRRRVRDAILDCFGDSWVWVVWNHKTNSVDVITTGADDCPLWLEGGGATPIGLVQTRSSSSLPRQKRRMTPLFCCDVFEHQFLCIAGDEKNSTSGNQQWYANYVAASLPVGDIAERIQSVLVLTDQGCLVSSHL